MGSAGRSGYPILVETDYIGVLTSKRYNANLST